LQGGGAKLSARDTDVTFRRAGDQTRVTADTDVIISGDIPGGYVRDAAARGVLSITTKNDISHISFTPREALNLRGWI
jgi:hypothetical protein